MSTLTSFFPLSGYAGDIITINGTGFTGATSLQIGGVEAAFFVDESDTIINAFIPNGAANGSVSVASPSGNSALAGFTFSGIRPGPVKLRMPNSPAYPDGATPAGTDLMWVWDNATGKLRQAPISSLPFTNDNPGDGSETTVPSPFLILPTTPAYADDMGTGPFMDYDEATNTTTIRDSRLLNKSLYPVSTTQLGAGDFRLGQLTYETVDPDDDTLGMVIITNFQLGEGEHITIIVPGEIASTSNTEYQQLLADVKLLKQIAAPFIPNAFGANGGKVWWPRAYGEIPAGWQECIAMRGFLPMAQNPDDIYNAETNPTGLSRPILTTGGAKNHTNSLEEMAPHNHTIRTTNTGGSNSLSADPVRGSISGSVNTEGDIGEDKTIGISGGVENEDGSRSAKEYSILNPYLIGVWIEFIGIG